MKNRKRLKSDDLKKKPERKIGRIKIQVIDSEGFDMAYWDLLDVEEGDVYEFEVPTMEDLKAAARRDGKEWW